MREGPVPTNLPVSQRRESPFVRIIEKGNILRRRKNDEKATGLPWACICLMGTIMDYRIKANDPVITFF